MRTAILLLLDGQRTPPWCCRVPPSRRRCRFACAAPTCYRAHCVCVQALRREAVHHRPVRHNRGGSGLPEPAPLAAGCGAVRPDGGGNRLRRPLPVAAGAHAAGVPSLLRPPSGHNPPHPVSPASHQGLGLTLPAAPAAPRRAASPCLNATAVAGLSPPGLPACTSPSLPPFLSLFLPLQLPVPLLHGGSDWGGCQAAEQGAPNPGAALPQQHIGVAVRRLPPVSVCIHPPSLPPPVAPMGADMAGLCWAGSIALPCLSWWHCYKLHRKLPSPGAARGRCATPAAPALTSAAASPCCRYRMRYSRFLLYKPLLLLSVLPSERRLCQQTCEAMPGVCAHQPISACHLWVHSSPGIASRALPRRSC